LNRAGLGDRGGQSCSVSRHLRALMASLASHRGRHGSGRGRQLETVRRWRAHRSGGRGSKDAMTRCYCPHSLLCLASLPSCSLRRFRRHGKLRHHLAPPPSRHCPSQHPSSSALLRATISTYSQCRSSLGKGLLATPAVARHDRSSSELELAVVDYHRSSLTPSLPSLFLPRKP
jgi:hypothetical protein